MFCMNCGHQLPDGAKFCLQCGTPQDVVSSTGLVQAETINLDGMHTFVPAMCPNCNAHMKVDTSSKVASCDTCGAQCLVQDAIKSLTVRGNVQVGSATINVSGTNIESLLQRVEIMLGDGDFQGAMSKCDTILDSDPTNGRVYFYMLMSNLHCRTRNDLTAQVVPFDGNRYFLKVMQYGEPELKNELQGYLNIIYARRKAEAARIEEERIHKEEEAKLKNLKVGDELYFGATKKKKCLWKVLLIKERKALIISDTILEKRAYHEPGGYTGWNYCTLRKWLNDEFINGYFTQEERDRILLSKLDIDYSRSSLPPTNDKVFLLSIREAKSLCAAEEARNKDSWWWLRSPIDDVAYVFCGGKRLSTCQVDVDWDFGVRPALWLNLNS